MNDPVRVLPPPPKRQSQGRNARAEIRAEKRRVLMTELTVKAEAKRRGVGASSEAPSSGACS